MLADFAARYPGTPQAAAAMLRRAVYKADPANQTATAHDATVLLDSTLAMPGDSASRADARALRRITVALERAATAASGSGGSTSASSSDSGARPDDAKATSDEVQRLRNELAKANAELERIKKRVAQPKP
jgi:chromosome segregation ATPase